MYTRRIVKTTSRNMATVSTRSPTTRSYTYTVVAVLLLKNCIEEVSHWMSTSRLEMNEHGQNGAALGWVTSWSGSAGERWSVLAAWD